MPHNYLETLDAIAKTDRRVLSFDPLGCGDSLPKFKTVDAAAAAATPKALAAQAAAAVEGTGLLTSSSATNNGASHHITLPTKLPSHF